MGLFDIFSFEKQKALKEAEICRQNALCLAPKDFDELLADAAVAIIENEKASIGMLQRILAIGFGRASVIMDQLEQVGIVGEEQGTRPRQILVSNKEQAIRIISQKCNRMHTLTSSTNSTKFDTMEGHEFEYFCADLLKKNGFVNVEVTQGSGDHGIDILAEKDDVSYAIQCKCYSSNIGNAAIQQALAGKKYYKRDIAVVLTNQYFTSQAKDEAKVFGVKLWDRDKLNDLIEKSNL